VAVRFLDSFLHYSTSQLLRKWTGIVQGSSAAWTINAGTGRWGGASLRVTYSGSEGRQLGRTLDNQQTWVVGFACKISAAPVNTRTILSIVDGGTAQVDVRLAPSMLLVLTRNGTVLGTAGVAAPVGSYFFLELKVLIASASGGSAAVTLNGTAVITVSAANTQATGNAYAQQVVLGPNNNDAAVTMDFSDLHILDGTGSAANTLIGDCRVDCLLPASDSATVQWTPGGSGGATHYTHVNEVPADDDVSYVQDSVVLHEDQYGMTALAAVPVTVYGVQIVLTGRKVGSGSRSIAGAVHSGLVDLVGSGAALGDQYGCVLSQSATDPATGLAWTAVGIAAAAFGPAVTA
jgi:hypothetical protein